MIFKTKGLILDGYDNSNTLNDKKKNSLAVFFDSQEIVEDLKQKNWEEILLKRALSEI